MLLRALLPNAACMLLSAILIAPQKYFYPSNSIMSILHNPSLSSTQKTSTKTSASPSEKETSQASPVIKLAPSMWLRAMTDFDAPFGHDGLPTVWG
jgi:hypothetical protein